MGGREGPLWKRITYKAPLGTPSTANPGTASVEDALGDKQQVSCKYGPDSTVAVLQVPWCPSSCKLLCTCWLDKPWNSAAMP